MLSSVQYASGISEIYILPGSSTVPPHNKDQRCRGCEKHTDPIKSLTSHNPIGLQGLLRDSFTFYYGQNVALLNAKAGGMCSNHFCAFTG
jgi:hypothetical protein